MSKEFDTGKILFKSYPQGAQANKKVKIKNKELGKIKNEKKK